MTNGIPALTRRSISSVGEPRAASIVLERLAARLGVFALLVELRRGAEAAIGLAGVEQTARVGLVPREVRALKHDLLVPDEPEPLEPLEDRPRAFLGAARLVGVLDAQEELAAVFLGEEPVEERRSRAADVEVAGGGRGEAETMAYGEFISPESTRARRLAGSVNKREREGRDSNPRYGF